LRGNDTDNNIRTRGASKEQAAKRHWMWRLKEEKRKEEEEKEEMLLSTV
jgi:hypothetical protein